MRPSDTRYCFQIIILDFSHFLPNQNNYRADFVLCLLSCLPSTREAEGTEVVVLVHIRTRLCLLFEDVISLDAHAAAVHHWNLNILTLKWLKCPRGVIYNPVIIFLMCICDDHHYTFLTVMSVSLVFSHFYANKHCQQNYFYFHKTYCS